MDLTGEIHPMYLLVQGGEVFLSCAYGDFDIGRQ